MEQGPRLVTSLFDGERLRQARLYAGLRKTELAEIVHVSPAAIGQYEQGRTRPSSATLAAMALALGFSPSFFERGRAIARVPEGQTHFRRLRATSKMDRDRLLIRLEFLGELLARIESHVRLPAVDLPTIPEDGDTPDVHAEKAAGEVRRQWQLGTGPIDNVVRLLETKGTIVVRPRVDTGDVDAFSTWAGTRPVVVLSCDKNDAPRSRFDAAHELGHLVMHHDAEPGRQSIEQQAHRFAAAFLMPADVIRNEFPARMSWPSYFALKQRWRVSLAALLYRARTLGALSSDAYQRAQIHLSRHGWRQTEPIDIGPPEQPVIIERALDLMQTKLGIDQQQLAREVRISTDVLDSLVRDAIPPTEPRPAVPIT